MYYIYQCVPVSVCVCMCVCKCMSVYFEFLKVLNTKLTKKMFLLFRYLASTLSNKSWIKLVLDFYDVPKLFQLHVLRIPTFCNF